MLKSEPLQLSATLTAAHRDLRLDQALAKCFPEHSRARLTEWIKKKFVTVDGSHWQPKTKVQGTEQIIINASLEVKKDDIAEELPLNILFEDEDILVINKAAGIVVHPAAGNYHGTLLNALLYHAPLLRQLPRAGIIHRLDKDTTGLMVVAKSLRAHTALVAMMARREIKREYLALVGAELVAGKTIDAPIGRHSHNRLKMAVISSGKEARTHFRCKTRFKNFTLLHVTLDTGRTHQIRVHLAHEGLPIVGDPLYGWRLRFPPQASDALKEKLMTFQRQALHAWRLSFSHPISGEQLSWEAILPDDFMSLLSLLPKREEYDSKH